MLRPHLQIMMIKFPFSAVHTALLCFGVIGLMRFLFLDLCFLVPPPLHVRPRPALLVAVTDALLG
jgi:hypothetical protein